jgi:hypothetical protein
MLPAWVNSLKQSLYVLHVDYKHIGAGRIVLVSAPRAAASVARLVISAVEIADHYVKPCFETCAPIGCSTKQQPTVSSGRLNSVRGRRDPMSVDVCFICRPHPPLGSWLPAWERSW